MYGYKTGVQKSRRGVRLDPDNLMFVSKETLHSAFSSIGVLLLIECAVKSTNRD